MVPQREQRHNMSEHAAQASQVHDEPTRANIQNASGNGGSPSEELAPIANPKRQGIIDDAEYAQLKAKALA